MIATQALGLGGYPFSGGKGRVTLGGERHWHAIGGEGPCGSLGFTFHRYPTTPRRTARRSRSAWTGILEGACPPFHADMDAAVDLVLDLRYGADGHLDGAGEPADPVARRPARACPAAVRRGDRLHEDLVPLRLGRLRPLPGDDRPVLMTVWYQAAPPRPRLLRPPLPARGGAGPRPRPHGGWHGVSRLCTQRERFARCERTGHDRPHDQDRRRVPRRAPRRT